MGLSSTTPALHDLTVLSPLTVDEVASLIRKSPRDVQRKIAAGTFRTVEPSKRGRTPLITVASLRAYLDGSAS